MKTAVSIPDAVFARAERFARRMKKSRSRIYSDAVAEYLARHSADDVTDAMNRAIGEAQDDERGFATAASRRTLKRSSW